MGPRKDRLKTYTIATAFAQIFSSLISHSLSHRYSADPSGLQQQQLESSNSPFKLKCRSVGQCLGGQYLGDHNVAVRRSTTFDETVQDKLRNLGGFPTACCSSDEHHRVTVDGGQYHLFKLFDGQLVTFHQHLQKRQV